MKTLKNVLVSVLTKDKKEKTEVARNYLIYQNIYSFERREYMKPIIKKVPKLLELGLLKKEDLYIDLTGGDDTMGVSDHYLILLRIAQNCRNATINSGATNLVPPYDFYQFSYTDTEKTGKWVYYKNLFTIDPEYGWTNFIDFWKTRKYGIFKRGYMYIDKGSGNRVSEEWDKKLRKLIDAYDSYMKSIKDDKINEINLKFQQLELESK